MSGAGTQVASAASPPPPIGAARLLPPPAPASRIPLPGGGELTKLPGDGDLLALTLDDGVNSEVVRLYTQLAKDTGIRMTYFVNGVYDPGATMPRCCGRWSTRDRSSWATTPGRIPT